MTSKPKQYNLRSGKATSVQIPVQLQIQREGVMATEPGTSTQDTDKCQVSVYDSDASSVDIDELVNQSDNDLDSNTPSTKYCKFSNDRPVLDSSNQSVTQDTINQAILTQLASIGKGLDNIEKSNVCKKSVDTAKIKANLSIVLSKLARMYKVTIMTLQMNRKHSQSSLCLPSQPSGGIN